MGLATQMDVRAVLGQEPGVPISQGTELHTKERNVANVEKGSGEKAGESGDEGVTAVTAGLGTGGVVPPGSCT